jgi:hypothetical protein
MTSPTATISGRVVGPDGLGRLGRITFTPASLGAPLPARGIVAGRTSIRIDTDGYPVGPSGQSVTVSPGDYEIDLNIPGDSGVHIRRRVTLSSGQIFTLADLLSGIYTPPQPPTPPPSPQPPADGILTPGSHEVRHAGNSDALEAANPVEVVDLGDGVLTWRRLDDGLVRPDGRGVQDADTPGILESMDKAAVIDLGNGALTWR